MSVALLAMGCVVVVTLLSDPERTETLGSFLLP